MRKLYLLLSFFLFSFVISCTSDLNDELPTEIKAGNTKDWDHVQLSTEEPPKQFGNYNSLGYGYNILGSYANENSTTLQIIDIAKFKSDNNNHLNETIVLSNAYTENYGADAADYSKKLSLRVAATKQFKLFGNTIPFSTAVLNNNKYDPSFIYGDYTHMIKQKRFRFNATPIFLSNYLTTEFSNDVEEKTAEQIVEKYGTHVAVDIYTGSVIDVIFQAKTTNPDRERAARAGVRTFAESSANQIDVEDAKNNYDKKLFYKTRGGDKNLAMSGIYNLRKGAPQINFSNWQSTSTAENSVLVDFGHNGLVILYDLIENPVKKAKLKIYIDQYINDQQVSL